MKQNTTPVLPIEVLAPYENIKRVEFIFKRLNTNNYNNDIYKTYPALVHKIFEGEELGGIVVPGEGNFVVRVPFTAEETLKMPVGVIYMDTRIVYEDGSIPETEIVPVNMNATLFEEVYAE